MPAYNVEKYIEDALGSLIRQSYGNLEIITVDDGSSDDTFTVIERMAARDDRIKAIRQDNRGVSAARNRGLLLATGDYICFLDADDTAEDTMIEKLVEAIDGSGADLAECRYSRWMQNGDHAGDYDFTAFDISFSSDREKIRFITDELLPYHMGFEVWSKIYRTDIIRNGKISFDEDCRIGEDLSFNIKYLLNCGKITGIEDRLVRYLIRDDSAMSGTGDLTSRISDDLIIASDVLDYIKENRSAEVSELFPDFFVKMMDHAFSQRTGREAAEAFKGIDDLSFAVDCYRKLDCSRESFVRLYGNDEPICRSKLHLYVKCSLKAASPAEHLLMFMYRMNRKRQGKSMPEDWKLPY